MTSVAFAYLAAGLGAGITVLGAGIGIGRLAAAALEASARQPEIASGVIRITMIIAAALIEGIALLAAVTCLLLSFK